MNLKLLPLLSILTLPMIDALVLPNPPYALSSKSDLPSSPTTNHAIDTASESTSFPTNNPPTTMATTTTTTTAIPIPIKQSQYDLERMSLPILKSTLQTCDVVFAVVALVLLVPGLVVVLVRGWNYLRNPEERDVEGEGKYYEEEALLGKGSGKGGSVMNQMENGNGREIVRNDGRGGDRKVMVEEEV
ncbi:hypothetical protein P168DRAFT_314003 [Aspergillus campestris IBT 28561]|uniref:Uncharacterized protein n=1 Tax=Aspergillus campestris (strain IBT 28561) TaxID=1392248 RepID=A0A2I1DDA8_ASPC2|nr:uncharacterized protein P168DRAFT_314003 [Aspergillus campestris IBT 28561]PKY07863.1 hypothetical protein P168DRAFT_314003 [Aspergillus campestris IBT 28561]